jgi:hypothetical protein
VVCAVRVSTRHPGRRRLGGGYPGSAASALLGRNQCAAAPFGCKVARNATIRFRIPGSLMPE